MCREPLATVRRGARHVRGCFLVKMSGPVFAVSAADVTVRRPMVGCVVVVLFAKNPMDDSEERGKTCPPPYLVF